MIDLKTTLQATGQRPLIDLRVKNILATRGRIDRPLVDISRFSSERPPRPRSFMLSNHLNALRACPRAEGANVPDECERSGRARVPVPAYATTTHARILSAPLAQLAKEY
jgi:hypothetical protein